LTVIDLVLVPARRCARGQVILVVLSPSLCSLFLNLLHFPLKDVVILLGVVWGPGLVVGWPELGVWRWCGGDGRPFLAILLISSLLLSELCHHLIVFLDSSEVLLIVAAFSSPLAFISSSSQS